jgi:phage tail sheath gpL-like
MTRLFARVMQDIPESDINGMSYPDMPIPRNQSIGSMAEYNNRDLLVKKGVSTVVLNKGAYEVQDLVTAYQAEGENPLQFNYCRNLNLDWNIADAYRIIEILKLRDKVLVLDNQVTSSTKAIKPKEWKAILYSFFEDLAERALIKDPAFSKSSLLVGINNDNPNRFDTFFRYQRTGIARIESTTVEAGF